MKKTIYTIGRDPDCDIYVFDTNNLISRNHATLKVKNGKYYIIDHSMNGTYVNGIKIMSEREVLVSRKDSITFAHVAEFDWGLIPDQRRKTIIILSSVFAAILAIIAAFICFSLITSTNVDSGGEGGSTTTIIKDTTSTSYPQTGQSEVSKPEPKFIDRLPSKEKPQPKPKEKVKAKAKETKDTKSEVKDSVVVKDTANNEIINAIY